MRPTLTGADGGDLRRPATPATSGVDGAWTIDGTITNAEGTGSYAGFRVNEVLSGVGSTTAVGRTPSVDGRSPWTATP